ncbi:MAG: hypothetical protein AB1476_06175 [Candidatus Hadarchaeota archaeon]
MEEYREWKKTLKRTSRAHLLRFGVLAPLAIAIVLGGIGSYYLLGSQKTTGLTIAFKDAPTFNVLRIKPTVKECWILSEDGTWTKIWSGEMTLDLTRDGNTEVLATVGLAAGTYVGDRVLTSKVELYIDANGDGDADDNVKFGTENNPWYFSEYKVEILGDYYYDNYTQPLVYGGSGGTLLYDIVLTPPDNIEEGGDREWTTTTVTYIP